MIVTVAVVYEGECLDLYEDGVCELGERLFLRNGTAQCDCAEVEVISLVCFISTTNIMILRTG